MLRIGTTRCSRNEALITSIENLRRKLKFLMRSASLKSLSRRETDAHTGRAMALEDFQQMEGLRNSMYVRSI